MTPANNTLKNLQTLAFGNDLIESFKESSINDYMSLNSVMGVVVKLKDGQTFRIRFTQSAQTELGIGKWSLMEGQELVCFALVQTVLNTCVNLPIGVLLKLWSDYDSIYD